MKYCLLLIGIFCFFSGFSQDLESFSKKDIVKVSGGVGLRMTSYTAIGMDQNRDPFLGQLNLNLNFNLLGIIDAPFSATLSSQSFTLSQPQPFNNFGISPKYKAFTLHLGYRSMNLSEFSLSGSQFLGVGLEVAPEGSFIKGKALWGRFAKPVFFNPDGSIAGTPSFSRIGWGGGVTLGKNAKNQVSLNVFKARDDATSLDIPADSLGITPADNLVLGIQTKQQLTKKISVDGEIDLSFYTNDVTVPSEVLPGYSYFNNLFLFHQNSTSVMKKAVIANLNYTPDFAKFKIGYRRVDPQYRTLGAVFINNDYEDLSLKTSFGLLKKKMQVSLSGGMARNNLSQDKVTRMLRLIGSVGVNYSLNEKWNASANFANFSTDTKQTIVLTLDSLSMIQTTRSVGGNLTRTTSSDKGTNSLSLNLAFQDAIVDQVRNSTFYNGSIGWNQQFTQTKLTLGANLMAMHTINEASANTNIGPSVMMGKPFAKDKLQLTFTGAYLLAYLDGVSGGGITNVSLNGNYALFKQHKIGFNASSLMKSLNTGNTTEITATMNYNYAF